MRIDLIYGTRPELLKLLPVLRELRRAPDRVAVRSIYTGQQPDLVPPLLARLGERPDVDLSAAVGPAPLAVQLSAMLRALDDLLAADPPGWVVVQGDTLSAFAGALAAFYRRVPVAHVEAGLRTRDLENPFPEELHRQLMARASSLHFAPTARAREQLLAEGVASGSILVTGNTSMDLVRKVAPQAATLPVSFPEPGDTWLVTLHRRENLPRLEPDLLPGFADLLAAFPALHLAWILHPGAAQARVRRAFPDHPRVRLLPPQDHLELMALLPHLRGVFTDSGGVTEECAALGVPTLVVRRVTERSEAVEAGNATVLGNRREEFVPLASAVLADSLRLRAMARPSAVFGDGDAAPRIVARLLKAPGHG
jgi:UDP-N-acetylglucosamine 2-epimerase (non-hydrolysing)